MSTHPTTAAPTAPPITRLPKISWRLPFYYGWLMLPLATLMMIATSPGQTFGVAAFNPSVREALSLSHSELAGAYLFASLLAAAPLPLIGWLIDRHGLKKTGLVVTALLAVGCVAMSAVGGLVTLSLGFLMLRTFGQGALTLVANNSLAMWFSRRLGLATGLAGLGVALAVAAVPPLYLGLIHTLGWRTAYLVIAGITLAMVPLIAILFRNRPEDMGQRIDGGRILDPSEETPVPEESFDFGEARRARAYWVVMLICAGWGMIGTAIFFNIVPICESKGFTEHQATQTFITFAVCMAVMQLVGGVLADRYRLNLLLGASAAGLCGGVLALWVADSVVTLHVYAALFGSAQGVLMTASGTLWPRYFGRTHLGKIRSSVWTATVAGCSLGPLLMGLCFDMLGGYGLSLAAFVVLLAVGTVAGLLATPPSKATMHTTPDRIS